MAIESVSTRARYHEDQVSEASTVKLTVAEAGAGRYREKLGASAEIAIFAQPHRVRIVNPWFPRYSRAFARCYDQSPTRRQTVPFQKALRSEYDAASKVDK